MRELRHTLGQLRLNELAVGPDGRNRCLLSAFRSRTGRNQPSNSKFVFGPSCWLRSLIKPQPGRALAYVDWSQQELAIAAALSRDPRMMGAYWSGDFYLTFAMMAGAVPPDATKQTHGAERDQFKTVPTQESVARQRLRVRVTFGHRPLDQTQFGGFAHPGMRRRQCQPAPPRFVLVAQHPIRVNGGQIDQSVAPFFLLA